MTSKVNNTKSIINDINIDKKIYEYFKEEALMALDVGKCRQESILILSEIIRDYYIDKGLFNSDLVRVNWSEVAEAQLKKLGS